MDKTDLVVETNVLIGLFKATMEQSSTMQGELKHNAKKQFNEWARLGWRMLNELEKNNLQKEDFLTSLSDVYHNVNLEVKKTLKESLSQQN